MPKSSLKSNLDMVDIKEIVANVLDIDIKQEEEKISLDMVANELKPRMFMGSVYTEPVEFGAKITWTVVKGTPIPDCIHPTSNPTQYTYTVTLNSNKDAIDLYENSFEEGKLDDDVSGIAIKYVLSNTKLIDYTSSNKKVLMILPGGYVEIYAKNSEGDYAMPACSVSAYMIGCSGDKVTVYPNDNFGESTFDLSDDWKEIKWGAYTTTTTKIKIIAPSTNQHAILVDSLKCQQCY